MIILTKSKQIKIAKIILDLQQSITKEDFIHATDLLCCLTSNILSTEQFMKLYYEMIGKDF